MRILGDCDAVQVDPRQVFGSEEAYAAVLAQIHQDLLKSPRDADVLLLAAYLYFMDGELEEAEVYLEEADRDGTAGELTRSLRATVRRDMAERRAHPAR